MQNIFHSIFELTSSIAFWKMSMMDLMKVTTANNTLKQTSPLLGSATAVTELSPRVIPRGLVVHVWKNTTTQCRKWQHHHSHYASDLPSTDQKGSPD